MSGYHVFELNRLFGVTCIGTAWQAQHGTVSQNSMLHFDGLRLRYSFQCVLPPHPYVQTAYPSTVCVLPTLGSLLAIPLILFHVVTRCFSHILKKNPCSLVLLGALQCYIRRGSQSSTSMRKDSIHSSTFMHPC